MNRKGWGFPSIMTVFVLVLVIMVLAMAQNGFDSKTINSTIESFNWSKYNQNVSSSIDRAEVGSPNYVVTILEIAKKAIDFMGYSIFAVGKLAMELARDNPNIINYKTLLFLVFFSLLAPIIYYVFMASMVIFLLIREWVLNRRERKKYREIKAIRKKYGKDLEG